MHIEAGLIVQDDNITQFYGRLLMDFLARQGIILKVFFIGLFVQCVLSVVGFLLAMLTNTFNEFLSGLLALWPLWMPGLLCVFWIMYCYLKNYISNKKSSSKTVFDVWDTLGLTTTQTPTLGMKIFQYGWYSLSALFIVLLPYYYHHLVDKTYYLTLLFPAFAFLYFLL